MTALEERFMREMEKRVFWKYETDSELVMFEFDMYQMGYKEMFLKWVSFMNAVGYVLDPVEMEKMWGGEE